MSINLAKVSHLLLIWAFFMGLIGLGLTWPTVVLVIGTVLYLIT